MFFMLILFSVHANNCITDLNSTSTLNFKTILERLYYSGRNIDDLGKYDECNKLSNSKYNLISLLYQDSVKGYLGLCLPLTCEKQEIEAFFDTQAKKYNLPVSHTKVIIPQEYSQEPLSYSAILALLFVGFLILLVVFGSLLEVYSFDKKPNNTTLVLTLLEFSILKNFKKFIQIPEKQDNLSAINGLRVVSTYMIISYHSFNTQFFTAMANPFESLEMFTDFSHKVLTSFRDCVEVFFLISGFLLFYTTMPEVTKKGKNFE